MRRRRRRKGLRMAIGPARGCGAAPPRRDGSRDVGNGATTRPGLGSRTEEGAFNPPRGSQTPLAFRRRRRTPGPRSRTQQGPGGGAPVRAAPLRYRNGGRVGDGRGRANGRLNRASYALMSGDGPVEEKRDEGQAMGTEGRSVRRRGAEAGWRVRRSRGRSAGGEGRVLADEGNGWPGMWGDTPSTGTRGKGSGAPSGGMHTPEGCSRRWNKPPARGAARARGRPRRTADWRR